MIIRLARAAARRLLPARARVLARNALPRRTRPAILMYHRVIATEADPWGLAVDPDRFREQVDFLARRRTVLALPEFGQRLARGALPRDAVAITFDDGYADNMLNAEPILAAAGLPATLFVVSGWIGRTDPFWWDELSAMILDSALTLECRVDLPDAPLDLRLPARETADDRTWRTWDAPRTARHHAYLALWAALRRAAPARRDEAVETLRRAAPPTSPAPVDRALTGEELRGMAARGTFSIGAHTVTHPVLPTLDAPARRREIEDGRIELQRILDREVATFAYPFGEADAATRAAVATAGFDWACAIGPIAGHSPRDPLGLPRVAALDVGAAGLARAMGGAPDVLRAA